MSSSSNGNSNSAQVSINSAENQRRVQPVPVKSSQNSKLQGRFWMLTIPSSKWERWEKLQYNCCWMRGQEEVGGSTGYRHWQLLVGFPNPIRFNRLKKMFPVETHVELTRSAFADEYVFKEDTAIANTRFELGDVIKVL